MSDNLGNTKEGRYNYVPNLEGFSDKELGVAVRVIKGSTVLYNKFITARNRNPRDVLRAQALLERVRHERNITEEAGRKFSPSLHVRIEFIAVLFKSRIMPAFGNFSFALSKSLARLHYKLMIEFPSAIRTLFSDPVDLQNGQNPIFAALGCVDSRIDSTELLSASLGEVLSRREAACDIEDANSKIALPEGTAISEKAAQFINMSVNRMGIRHVVIVHHGKCGGIKESAAYIDIAERPEDPQQGLLWDMAQSKREVFADVRRNGLDYYLSRLDKGDHKKLSDDYDAFLQAAEICCALRDNRITRKFLNQLGEAGQKSSLSTIYTDLRTLNPYILQITGEGEGDWRLIRLTNHPELPQGKGLHKSGCKCCSRSLEALSPRD